MSYPLVAEAWQLASEHSNGSVGDASHAPRDEPRRCDRGGGRFVLVDQIFRELSYSDRHSEGQLTCARRPPARFWPRLASSC